MNYFTLFIFILNSVIFYLTMVNAERKGWKAGLHISGCLLVLTGLFIGLNVLKLIFN